MKICERWFVEIKELLSKIKEALISALPITAIVYILSFTPWFDFSRTEIISFTIGTVLLVLGIGFSGQGTAQSELVSLLGLNIHKAVLFSVVREDKVETIMNCLEDKFKTIKNGQGISFAVPLSSVIGVNLYRFLSNNR